MIWSSIFLLPFFLAATLRIAGKFNSCSPEMVAELSRGDGFVSAFWLLTAGEMPLRSFLANVLSYYIDRYYWGSKLLLL